jgi:hypothetical protein
LASARGQSGWLIYSALNLTVCVILVVGAAVCGGSLTELPYVMLLFAVCSSAIPFITEWNGAFAMLGVVGAVYFLGFGMADALGMLSPLAAPRSDGALMDGGEALLLTGTLVQMLGFHLGVRLTTQGRTFAAPRDWPRAMFLPLGLILWGSGAAADLYQSLVVETDKTSAAVAAGFAKLGIWNTSGLILIENYAGPLGIMILAYWWTRWQRRGSGTLMVAVIVIQFAVGWLVDQKETALNAPAVMLLTRFVMTGRVPTRWFVCTVLGMVLVFPVLTAKRIIMTEGLGLTRAQAVAHTWEILVRAVEERESARQGNKYEQKSQSFLERVTDKAAVEVFVAHVGVDHPYRLGSTLDAMLYAFVPRVVWSDKPGDNSAVTFNREFHFSADPDTHISPTHLGELYWNFGLPGVIGGMMLIGALLGFLCARFDPSKRTSITGVLVIIVTFYELVGRRGGQIEIEYVVWARTMLLIGLLHLMFSRRQGTDVAASGAVRSPLPSAPPRLARFPNLLS